MKQQICNTLKSALLEKIAEVQEILDSAKLAKESETKSSAGDKYETSREMIQFEQDKAMGQLGKLKQQLHELNKVTFDKIHDKIQFGSLVKAENGDFFLGIPYGKIEVDGKAFFAISMASPIGQAILNKKAGESFSLNTKSFKIITIQ